MSEFFQSGQPQPSPLGSSLTAFTPILGRDQVIEQVLELLDGDSIRILTLMGPGGVGKTRLALEVVKRAGVDFAHGACVVPLASIRDPALVPVAVLHNLGVQEVATISSSELLEQYLKAEHRLLVLDNLEHLVESVSRWLSDLVANCPRLKVLVTSRVALNVAGEQRFEVAPLPVPVVGAAGNGSTSAAVELFTQRAHAVRPDLAFDEQAIETVAAICREVEGLPLAIELAAARVNVLSLSDILLRLSDRFTLLTGHQRDAPPRHQSMSDSIAWSYDLLSEAEQSLFQRLSVFVGGFSLAAAEFVATHSESREYDDEAMDVVGGLVDSSIFRPVVGAPEPRFEMLETLREYGLNELATHGLGDAALDTHAAWFTRLAAEAEPGLRSPDQATWLNRIESDHSNIRAASSWLTTQGRIAEAIELYANIEWFLFIRGHAVESRRQFETWLTRPELKGDDQSRALALFFAGARAADLGNRSASISMMEEALAIFRQNGDRFHENYALNIISWTLFFDDQLDRAADGLNQSVDIGREMAHVRWTSLALELLAQIANVKGETDLAQRLANESMEIALDGGDLWCIQLITGNLGYQSLLDGELERAERLTNEAERIAEELGDIRNQPAHHMQLAEIARERGEQKFASDHLQISLEFGRQTGNALLTAVALLELGKLACELGDHYEALKLEKESLDLFQQLGGPSNIVYCLEGFALIAEAVGDRPTATQFLGAADELVTDLGIRMTPPLRVDAIQLANVPRGARWSGVSQTVSTNRAETSVQEIVANALAYELPSAVSSEEIPSAPQQNPLGLSDREIEVPRIMSDGMSNQQIADALYITRHTAMNHVNNILGKLDVTSRTAAVAIAIRSGIA